MCYNGTVNKYTKTETQPEKGGSFYPSSETEKITGYRKGKEWTRNSKRR